MLAKLLVGYTIWSNMKKLTRIRYIAEAQIRRKKSLPVGSGANGPFLS